MIKFKCGTTCDCLNECKGNPDPKLVAEFNRLKLFDEKIAKELLEKLSSLKEWTFDNLSNCVGKIDKAIGSTINIALIGKASNPVPCIECLEILGKEETLKRLSNPRLLMFISK
jgi:hypothetical protein